MYDYRVVSTDITGRGTIDSQHNIYARAQAAARKAQRQHDDRGNQIEVTVEAWNGSCWMTEGYNP
jgi:sRNA-binding protein